MKAERQALLRTRWDRLLRKCGIPNDSAAAIFNRLTDLYAEPHRYYHHLGHIDYCLQEFDRLPPDAQTPDLEFALWFHDAIYDPNRNDNEAASAALARTELQQLGLDSHSLAEIERLILATDHRDPPSREDERLIVDIDLSILGQSEAHYDEYAADIRQEYTHVPDSAYRLGRASVLQKFLNRNSIFSTNEFQRRYESQARKNLTRELAALEK